ncbi:MAG: TonB-dependent receptor plug domain-containing protein [Steroidobacteraceae bacterium]
MTVLALSIMPARAGAAEASKAATDTGDSLEELVVTGSRITSAGFTQPTPTTMLSAPDIEKVAEPNLFNAIAELPALQGSTGRTTFANSTSSGMQGLSSFSLRNLGTIRTLTLLDGQRVTPANVTGVADVSQFPQLLMKRVDVVTGGASASYGSDAIGGVVNFVTDTKFVGFKANLEAGETTYQDDKNGTAQAAWGNVFLNDRLHVEASGEYSKENGVPSGGFGVGPGAGGRTWFTAPAFQVRPIATTTDGKPQYSVIQDAQQYQYAKYGLVTNGPLQGQGFGVNGAPYTFLYGSNGTPKGNGQVNNCFSPFCVGGDLSGDVGQSTSLAARLQRSVGYTRVGFDLNDNNEVYVTANLARVTSLNQPNAGAEKTANLTIHCDNPYLPASFQADCASKYPAGTFGFGTSNGEFPNPVGVNAKRQMLRLVAGADGSGDVFGTKWSYNGYYAHGTNRTSIDVDDISLTARYNAAIDAFSGPNGTIVCRSAAAQASGCTPLNVIGQVAVDPAALAYVLPANGPRQRSRQEEHVVSFNVSGEPFSLWAGPVAIATGAEYRNESYVTRADPYGNGVTADSPYSAAYPADPLLNTAGNNWYAGNYHNGQGSYHVAEAYLEQNLPFLKSERLGEANLNLAVRQTRYSTSGSVTAWKAGGTWKTPIDGLTFRTVTSRDIRAPNLSELFAPPVVTNSTVISNGSNITVLGETVGNTNLKPEIARNTTFGIVLSQPQFLPGFSASIDYYDIRIANEISTLTAQNEVDLCAAGNQELCSQMLLTSTLPNTNYVKVQAFNLATVRDKGFDVEAMYRTGLAPLGLPGSVTLRALATHAISFLTNSGIIGTIPVQSAGVNQGTSVNSGGIPKWKAYFTQGWDTDKFSLTITERWFTAGVYSNEFIQCQTNCPVSTVAHTTIDNNVMKGATYVDLGGTFNVSDKVTAYFKVDNLLNKSPEPAPQTSVYYGANPYLYDVLGRMYRVGVRMGF